MVKKCNADHLVQCIELAFMRNSIPESNCAFCPTSKESIIEDLGFILNDVNSLLLGYFADDNLLGFLGCFVNPENNWGDCVGPFFMDKWNPIYAKVLFRSIKEALPNVERFNFYFNTKNKDCINLMSAISAERQDNEYILMLNKKDYIPQVIKASIVSYEPKYEDSLVRLHDQTFPNIYVTGRDIITSINKTREVFCALDDTGEFAGYGVLKFTENNDHLTAEIFAVEENKRGNGYGWALLNSVVDSAFKNHNGDNVDLVVDKLNTRARNLYYSCGFKLVVENAAFRIKT